MAEVPAGRNVKNESLSRFCLLEVILMALGNLYLSRSFPAVGGTGKSI